MHALQLSDVSLNICSAALRNLEELLLISHVALTSEDSEP